MQHRAYSWPGRLCPFRESGRGSIPGTALIVLLFIFRLFPGQSWAAGSQSLTISEELPKTYTITATNERGSASSSITLKYPPPSASFTTQDGYIKVGESATLNWTTSYADKCTITPDVGEAPCGSGSITVSPDKPKHYFLKVEGQGGTKSYSLYITYVSPSVDIQATPETIKEGESTTLSWVFSNTTSCYINQGVGAVEQGQTLEVSPRETTTYIITGVALVRPEPTA